MTYLKTFLITFLVSSFFSLPFFIKYHDIDYINVLYILCPFVFIIVLYLFFKDIFRRKLDIRLLHINFNFLLSFLLLGAALSITLLTTNINGLIGGDFAEIRSDFANRDVSLADQLVPLLMVYPFAHLLFMVAEKKSGFNLKIILLILGLIIIGMSAGGRQIIFMVFILILTLRNGRLFKKKIYTVLTMSFFVLMAALVTIGRNNDISIDKVVFLESLLPGEVSPWLSKPTENPAVRDVGLEVSFYFGHQIPAFCNKIDNLSLDIFPRYVFGMQPFIERQLYKVGVVRYSQEDRYLKLLDLSKDTGFFSSSWSTGFLDVYYNLGLWGGAVFFSMVALLLFICAENRKFYNNTKYKVLTAINVLFIVTMFMTPAFFDTTIFFTYVFVFINDPKQTINA